MAAPHYDGPESIKPCLIYGAEPCRSTARLANLHPSQLRDLPTIIGS